MGGRYSYLINDAIIRSHHKQKDEEIMATTTAQEFAAKVGTDGRTVRKFLRSVTPKDEQPGKGSRWAIENRSIRSLTSQFSKWDEAQKAAKETEATDEG